MRAIVERLLAHTQVYGYGVLATLLLLLVAHLSLESDIVWVQLSSLILSLATIIVASIAVAHTRMRLYITPVLAIVAIISTLWDYFGGTLDIEVLTIPGQLLFWYICYCLVVDLLSRWGALPTQLLAAICLYIVMAIAFSRLYLSIDKRSPVSTFTTTALTGDEGRLSEDDAIYYSFVTQTTLGYGDITPTARATRAVATIQATIGVLYIAVVVAAIVGARKHPPPGAEKDPQG